VEIADERREFVDEVWKLGAGAGHRRRSIADCTRGDVVSAADGGWLTAGVPAIQDVD
jgi:hypothetical protein